MTHTMAFGGTLNAQVLPPCGRGDDGGRHSITIWSDHGVRLLGSGHQLRPPLTVYWRPPWGGGILARSHGLVFSSAAGGAHWQIAIRCPSLPFPSVKVHQAAVLVPRFCFSMVAGCVDQNIKDPYGNTLHLHEVTFMLMAECFHRVCG